MRIRKIGVVGSGTMGGAIAALSASVGIPVVLLDIAAAEGDRSGPAEQGLKRAVESKPPAFLSRGRAGLVTVGNLEDDFERLADCDWVIEVIVEKPEPKKALYARLEALLPDHAIVTTNTSGIPVSSLAQGRTPSFRKRFFGTHFFNPPRHLHLLELIPTAETDPELLREMAGFGERILGKGVVVARDTPGFIANRLGVYMLSLATRLMDSHQLTIEEADILTGPLVGRPNSATFRTADLSGLDVLKVVRDGLATATGDDFGVPAWVDELVARGALGEKSGEGFYKRSGDSILTLAWQTGEYRPREKPQIPGTSGLEGMPLADRLRGVLDLPGKYGAFSRALLAGGWSYALERAPEIAYDLPAVDRALEWGFAWELGPFRQMDAVGLERVRELLRQEGSAEPPLLQNAGAGFYRDEQTVVLAFDGSATRLPERPGAVDLPRIRRSGGVIEENDGAALLDLGEGVILLEFRSKMGTLDGDVIDLLHSGLERIRKENRPGLVIGHGDPRAFSAGANLKTTLSAANSGRWDELDQLVRDFQRATMAIRYASCPVVVAPFGLTLGGGAELTLHAGAVQAHGELYMGLVEAGVGLIPAGGGTKELLFRFMEELAGYPEADPFEAVRRAFDLIAVARVSGSALEAGELGLLRSRDRITMNRDFLLADARARVLDLAPDWIPPVRGTIQLLGGRALGNLRYGISAMREGGRITDHEAYIGERLAYILCGGDGDPREVTEQDVLDLEREAFLELLGTEKTRERIRYTLETGKTLRN
ncbi:MAG: 3-hydroxyacyl-CoA dehydrogenase/enoyl-CoA hydratase family protein [Gemmatimonadota bacterium]|jgi:3-hydroxyacyl-CoA dehydrogenase|nr:3-hydroxyacyl-CoA dehydrogenase/enoyl-CoA hydratase family protein [Gemmatimonadota bacterium]